MTMYYYITFLCFSQYITNSDNYYKNAFHDQLLYV
jgi:hypothetical protein